MSITRDVDLAKAYANDRPKTLAETSLTRRQEGIFGFVVTLLAFMSLLLYGLSRLQT